MSIVPTNINNYLRQFATSSRSESYSSSLRYITLMNRCRPNWRVSAELPTPRRLSL